MTLRDVLPRSALDDMAHAASADTKATCGRGDGRPSGNGGADVLNRTRCQTSMMDALSSYRSAFRNHVGRVLLHCAEPQVVRVATARVVTGVTNAHPLRNRAMHQLPRNPVGLCRFPPQLNCAVPLPQRTRPQPAGTRLVEAFPKLCQRSTGLAHAAARTGAVLPLAVSEEDGAHPKEAATLLTGSLHKGRLTTHRSLLLRCHGRGRSLRRPTLRFHWPDYTSVSMSSDMGSSWPTATPGPWGSVP